VVCIITLTVATILGLALLQAAGNNLLTAERSERVVRLSQIAEGGVEYGYWYYAGRRPTLPVTFSETLGGGQFSVTVSEYPAIPGTVKVRSTATLGGQQLTKTYLLARPAALEGTYSVFNYAICSDQSLSTDKRVLAGTGSPSENDVNVNGQLSLTNTSSRIWGDCYAAWGISSPYPTVTGTTNAAAPMLPFPDIDWTNYYNNRAAYYYDADMKSGITFPYDGAIIWVDHDLKFKGPITGRGIIVAQHNLEFTGSTSYAAPTSVAAFIGGSKIKCPASTSLVGFMYAHSNSFTSYFEMGSNVVITKGALVGDRFQGVDNLTVTHDADIVSDPSLGSTLHLPGY
jgi:hypothetical protein